MTTITGTAALNRREMLIAGKSLATASALGAVASTQMAQAQAPPTVSGAGFADYFGARSIAT